MTGVQTCALPISNVPDVSAEIKEMEDKFDDDTESVITNERYVYISSIIGECVTKNNKEKLTTSDKIDRIVTNRWAALPIFAVVMFIVYYVSVTTVGALLTDWTNDTLFGEWIIPGAQSFFEGIKFAKAGNHLHDISAAIQKYAESFGYGVVRELVGHGIGTHLHEDPQIPNFKTIGRGIRLRPGMTLAIEPMITMGDYAVSVLDDDWTVVTDDNSLAAHYENTVLITEGDPEILTLPNWDKKEWQ